MSINWAKRNTFRRQLCGMLNRSSSINVIYRKSDYSAGRQKSAEWIVEDWLIYCRGFYVVLAKFQPYNDGEKIEILEKIFISSHKWNRENQVKKIKQPAIYLLSNHGSTE